MSAARHRQECASILRWWDGHGRKQLPWQRRRTPYTALLAELMLQQTTVATVMRYYPGFLRRFPSARALARAELDEVLQQWQGLGYYARARNLRRACQCIVERGGRWPADALEWMRLPGVGRSTANAIVASLSDEPHAILDGNVKRVLARVFAIDKPIKHAATIKLLWQHAEDFLPARRGRDFAQAMMDLGALQCTRTRPSCQPCPLRTTCLAHQRGLVDAIPQPVAAAPKRRHEHWLLFIGRRGGRYLLGSRPPSGIWGGLWTPPMPETSVALPELGDWLQGKLAVAGTPKRIGLPIRHELTHIRLELHPVQIEAVPKRPGGRLPARVIDAHSAITYSWHLPDEVPGGLPTPVGKLAKRIACDGALAFERAL